MTTDGNVVHYGYIEKFIESLGEKYNIREIAYDRWGAVQMVQIPVHIKLGNISMRFGKKMFPNSY